MQPTPAQSDAIHILDQNLMVVAGAGSGKTRVLVERYINLLDQNPDWELGNLVAITFTREAALEMRNRVRQTLMNRLQHEDVESRLEHYGRLLAVMDSARIATIHSLCSDILRSNAAQAGLDPEFEVLEEIDAQILLEDVVDTVMQSWAVDRSLALELLLEHDATAVRDVLTNSAVINAFFQIKAQTPNELFLQWKEQWEADAKAELERFLSNETFVNAVYWEGMHADIPEEDKLAQVWVAVRRSFEELQFTSDGVEGRVNSVQSLIQAITLRGGAAKNWGGKPTLDQAKDQLRVVRELGNQFLNRIGAMPGELDEHAAQSLFAWQVAIHDVQHAYAQRKREYAQLDFDDLETLTCQLLENHPDVRLRYQGAEFQHILVDEFQDTNPAQWQIVQHLTDLTQGGRVFVVGDPKQSIYGFRGGDVRVFNSVQDKMERDPNALIVTLAHSFRSHPDLVGLFNRIFTQVFQPEDDNSAPDFAVDFGQPMDAFRKDQPNPISIELSILNKYQKDGDNADDLKREQLREWEADVLAERIQSIVSKVNVQDVETQSTRTVHYGDIAILFQSMKHVNLYEAALKAHNIPYVTLAGRGYYNQQEVWDCLNLLKVLHDPQDDLALAAVLRSPIFGLSDDVLFALRLLTDEAGQRLTLWESLQVTLYEPVLGITEEDQPQIQYTVACLLQLSQIAGRVTIAELLQEIFHHTGYLAILTGLPDGDRRRRNVEKLLEIATKSRKVLLGDFIRYLDDLTNREVREGEALLDSQGAVRLMTVHASKGLEFPIVILAEASRDYAGRQNAPFILSDDRFGCRVYDHVEQKSVAGYAYNQVLRWRTYREEQETLRLLYVAATRARDYVLVSGYGKRKSPDMPWDCKGWLGLLVSILGIAEDSRTEPFFVSVADSHVAVNFPKWMDFTTQAEATNASFEPIDWDIQDDVEPIQPYLLQSVESPPDATLQHLSVTQLQYLGGYKYASSIDQRRQFAYRLRQGKLFDVAPEIPSIETRKEPPVQGRIIGEMVHEALRYCQFIGEVPRIEDLLRSYAWKNGLTNDHLLDEAVERAMQLLRQFQSSEMYEWIQTARKMGQPFFTELPFIYRTEKRILHGVMDALFQHPDGHWLVVDYKTSFIPGSMPNIEQVKQHSRQFHLQIGAYAAAIAEHLQETPLSYVHYVRYNQTIHVPADVWMTELMQLEHEIGHLMSGVE